jgi:uncharacterized Zn-binding protein involved in type VI secretion
MPSHILINNLGLTYKGTVGVSTATLPDVCKTPSPGGPVPIPYPNVANQGSLSKGTKTVKAKGKMIAVKGSQYSSSVGDEPGTVGGVKSSTFKKETAWITYSFDVKMDGKNACRHTDKKFHNHKNTADLQGNMDPAVPAVPFVVNIDCKAKMNDKRPGKAWDNCMCQQLCAKIKKMDNARKKGKIVPSPGARLTPEYSSTKAKFIRNFMEKVKEGKGVRRQFIHKCAADKYMEKIHPENPTKGGHDAPFNADHMHEAALGGSLKSMCNLKMLDKRVNQSISFEAYEPEGKHKGKPIKAHSSCNCPHGPEGPS